MSILHKVKQDLRKRIIEAQAFPNNRPLLKSQEQLKKTQYFESEKGEGFIIALKSRSLLLRLSMQRPLSFNHVANFFNLIGINQKTIRNSQNDESYFKTMFYVKKIEKVDVRKSAIILSLKNNDCFHSPLDYIVNRFKSFGDRHFYSIACQLEELSLVFSGLKDDRSDTLEEEVNEPLSKYLDSMNDSMYMSKVYPDKLVISRKLLQFLGYDADLFAVKAVKYRSVMDEIISSEFYTEVVSKSLECLKVLILFLQSKITREEFERRTTFEYNDSLITADQRKTLCRMRMHMPNPMISSIEVEEVLGEPEVLYSNSANFRKQRKVVREECEMLRRIEVETLKSLITLPKNMLPENKERIADYKEII